MLRICVTQALGQDTQSMALAGAHQLIQRISCFMRVTTQVIPNWGSTRRNRTQEFSYLLPLDKPQELALAFLIWPHD